MMMGHDMSAMDHSRHDMSSSAPAKQQLPAITISPAVMQNMGVRTVSVTQGQLNQQIQTVGVISYDEDRLVHVHSRAEGWVENLKVRAVGDVVKRGDLLSEMYSPEVLAAQEDYLVALRSSEALSANRREQMADRVANRLRLFNLPESFINRIRQRGESQNRYPLLAPQSGIISRIGIRQGMYVEPETELYTIADLSEVWVMVDVFEQQLAWLREDLPATMQIPAKPAKTWQGTVDYIYPELDPMTRTLKVRLRFANPDGRLKPNLFAEVTIAGKTQEPSLLIPQQAVITTGERTSVVVAQGDGRFQPVDVQVGLQAGEDIEILDGLKAGQEIVVSGQFLLDSESNLQASFQRLGGHEH